MCGFLIAFGLLTRLAAFIASGEMAVAFFMFGFSGRYSVTRRPRWSDSYQFSMGRNQPCCIAGASFSLSSMARADGVSMR